VHFLNTKYRASSPVLRSHDILECIRIRRSMPLTNGSRSWIRILLVSSLTFKMPTKNFFFKNIFFAGMNSGINRVSGRIHNLDPERVRSTQFITCLIQSICLKESLSPGPFTSTNQISSVSGFHSVRSGNPDLSRRRKIRLIESNSKCRYLKKIHL
jgi:hypothetical protein